MERVLMYGTGNEKIRKLVFDQERCGDIQLIEAVGQPKREALDTIKYILVMDDAKYEETKKIYPTKNIIKASALTLPGVRLDRYIMYRDTRQSIIANNCWGGYTAHSLGLEFLSPFVNLRLDDEDYIKLLKSPKQYIEKSLQFLEYIYVKGMTHHYPIVALGDLRLYCNHYLSYEHALEKWEIRKKKINWDNLFVMMFTENESIAEQFSKLPYKKKVCFVPFKTSLPCVHYIDLVEQPKYKDVPFWSIIIQLAMGQIRYYDWMELLANGRIVKLEES